MFVANIVLRAVVLICLVAISYQIGVWRVGAITDNDRYTIVAGGDVMLGRRTSALIEIEGYGDASYPWEYVIPEFTNADIAFVNLEGVASWKGKPLDKRYVFRFAPELLDGLVSAGIDVVSQANNHALDFGYAGLCDSYQNIVGRGMLVVGTGCNRTEATTPAIKQLPDGTRVAFYALSAFYQGNTATAKSPGFTPYSVDWVINQARKLKEEDLSDIVIVSVHRGTEHRFKPDPDTVTMYRQLVDGGVDVVLGHHPHVPQPIEHYNNGWIAYSLGNLIFDMHDRIPHTKKQILAKVVIEEGKVAGVHAIPIEMTTNFQPYIVSDKKRIRSGKW